MGDLDSFDLDALLADRKADAPQPDAALLARVLGDAEAVQPAVAAPAPVQRRPAPRRPFWASFKEQLGGWPALAALASMTAAGLLIGAFPPDALGTQVAAMIGSDALGDLFTASSSFDFTQFEG